MGTVQFSDNRFTCIYCFKSHSSPSGTGVDVECCGEIGHVQELMDEKEQEMSDGIKRWHEDQDDYLELCKRFREEPQYVMSAYGNLNPDCYGQHATELQMRAMREEKRRKKK